MKSSNRRIIILVLSSLVVISVVVTTPYSKNFVQWLALILLGIIAGLAAISEIIGIFDHKISTDHSLDAAARDVLAHQTKFRITASDKSPELFRTSVALWGPVASGKSWLINAFAQTLLTQYTKPIEGLRYEFIGTNLNFWEYYLSNLSQTPESTFPNIPAPMTFRFERHRTTGNRREALSSFAHEINIYDYSGEFSTDDSDFRKIYLPDILTSLATTDIIIVTLDPQNQLPKDNYINMIRQLFDTLEKANPNKRRFYAICLTKADTVPGGINADPDGLIDLLFGPEITELFKVVSKKHAICSFVTSSVGYIPGTEKPNLSREEFSISISDKEHWRPYGVEYPFFWAFESIEMMRIRNKLRFGGIGIKRYIPYPEPQYQVW